MNFAGYVIASSHPAARWLLNLQVKLDGFNSEVKMKLIQLGRKTWSVLAVCDDRDDCQVLDHLMGLTRSVPAVKRMHFRLTNKVPESGPEFSNKEKAKLLRDEIYEFRESPSKGPKPRVFFFLDPDEQRVICTEAIEKRDDGLDVYINRAIALKQEYLAAKITRQLEIQS